MNTKNMIDVLESEMTRGGNGNGIHYIVLRESLNANRIKTAENPEIEKKNQEKEIARYELWKHILNTDSPNGMRAEITKRFIAELKRKSVKKTQTVEAENVNA
jgi:hypothetical protein